MVFGKSRELNSNRQNSEAYARSPCWGRQFRRLDCIRLTSADHISMYSSALSWVIYITWCSAHHTLSTLKYPLPGYITQRAAAPILITYTARHYHATMSKIHVVASKMFHTLRLSG